MTTVEAGVNIPHLIVTKRREDFSFPQFESQMEKVVVAEQ